MYTVIKSHVDPQRLVLYLFSAVVLWWRFARDRTRSTFPKLEPWGVPRVYPIIHPSSQRPLGAKVVDAGMRALSDGFLKQQEILSRLADSQERLASLIAEVAQDRRADALLREATGLSQSQPEHSSPLLRETKSCLESFGAVLRKDQRPGSPLPDQAASEAPKPDTMSPGHSHETLPSGSVGGVAGSSPVVSPSQPHTSPNSDWAAVISRLKKSTETPQEVFVKCLEKYRQEDLVEWARQFTVGYRQRVAPPFLGEVYNHGHNAKHWAKQFVKERELGDFLEARDLIPAMAAIGSLILQDRAANVINSAALERLAKKGYAIFQACRAVRSEKDWRRPKDAKKDWRSKVDPDLPKVL